MKSLRTVPQSLQGILWSTPIKHLDLEEDKVYIINQVLSYGTLSALKWLFATYSPQTIHEVFVNHPIKHYTAPRFNFLKFFLLNLKGKNLKENRYVQNLPRDIR